MATMAMSLANTSFYTSTLSIAASFRRLNSRHKQCLSLKRRRILACNSVETASESSSQNNAESSIESEPDSSPSVAGPRSFSSLVTSANIRKALDGVEVVSVDHYSRLGLPRGCSYAEVSAAFKVKCENLMQQGLDEETAQSKLQDLKESFEILSSEEERRFYDWSMARAESPERYIWPYEVDITQRQTIPAPPRVMTLNSALQSLLCNACLDLHQPNFLFLKTDISLSKTTLYIVSHMQAGSSSLILFTFRNKTYK